MLRSLYDPRVLAASLIYFGVVAALYGVGFWLPSIVKGFGVSIALTGWITAIPYAVGFVGMILWGMSSDSSMERIGHLSIALAIAAIGIGASAALDDPLLKMVALTFGAFGVFASLPIFWTLPTAILSGATAAAGIAAINSIGNLSGYFGPFVIGWIKDATGSFAWGLAAVAACAAAALVIALALGHDRQLEKAPENAEIVTTNPDRQRRADRLLEQRRRAALARPRRRSRTWYSRRSPRRCSRAPGSHRRAGPRRRLRRRRHDDRHRRPRRSDAGARSASTSRGRCWRRAGRRAPHEFAGRVRPRRRRDPCFRAGVVRRARSRASA